MRKCPANDCTKQIPPELAFCKIHWFKLPAGIRRRIWAGYRGEEGSNHAKAMEEAQEFLSSSQSSRPSPSRRKSSSQSGSSPSFQGQEELL